MQSHIAPVTVLRSLLLLLLPILCVTRVAADDSNGPLLSDNTANHYYQIQIKADSAYNMIAPATDGGYVTTSNSTNEPERTTWYFHQASKADDGTVYYHIINAETDLYMYYTDATTNALTMATYSEEHASPNKFEFRLEANSGYFNIIPKDATGSSIYVNKSSGVKTTNKNIGLYSNKNDDNSLWRFTEATFLCKEPTLTNEAGTITLTSATQGVLILYTIDGTSPNSTSYQLFNRPFTLPTDVTIIKAMAIKSGDRSDKSRVHEYSVPRSAKPQLSFNDTTGLVTISGTEGATYYYTTNGSEPSLLSTVYDPENRPHLTTETTVKAIAREPGHLISETVSRTYEQVATPVIADNGANAIAISCASDSAIIYYTTDGSTPTIESAQYTEPLRTDVSGKTIKAIALSKGQVASEVSSQSVTLQCEQPVIIRNGNTFTFRYPAFPADGVTIYYTTDGSTPTTGSSAYDDNPINVPTTVKAIAVADNYHNSGVLTRTFGSSITQTDGFYIIDSEDDYDLFVSQVNADTDGTGSAAASYKVTSDFAINSSTAITQPFSGVFDGQLHTISNLDHPLFNTISGGVVHDVILRDVRVSVVSGNAGAIAADVIGTSDRVASIYNCGILSGTVFGPAYTGGLVGCLGQPGNTAATNNNCYARVVNCYSYADITGGTNVGGIVGNNCFSSTATNIRSMIMNCMFYGDITGGTSKAPIYNGNIISNKDANGINNFNYFCAEATYAKNIDIQAYHCALMVEKRYLQRFEFFRHLLNSNRALAAWWATGSLDNRDKMMKWVMLPENIGSEQPYPILMKPGKYPSIVNPDAENATTGKPRNQGGKLGELEVIIQMGDGKVYERPEGATITKSKLTLNITDKDTTHYNFNYYKVQLPYYNDVGTKNYTGNRVVTGWKIVSINGSTEGTGTFTSGVYDVTFYEDGSIKAMPYNFADRTCTKKDLYSVTGRIFNQGAYWDVPEGVTTITIEPYWAKAVYLSDAYPNVVYNQGMSTAYNVANIGGGQRYQNNTEYDINGSLQKVFTTIVNGDNPSAKKELNPQSSHTVFDNAIVLIGNYHYIGISSNSNNEPYTIMSADLDGDNEPDNTYILRFNGRATVHPVRVDFLNVPGLGMAQKSTGGTGTYNLGIMQPLNWFEVTNTSLFRVTQFEYSPGSRTKKPIILHGGVIEQWVCLQGDPGDRVEYFHVGGNVWFKEFHLGIHQDRNNATPHPPVSVTGGDYDVFYLTGAYNASASRYNDNAECYINGGRFGTVAGTGMEGIGHKTNHTNGNIVWQIDNADIKEFYAGGINAAEIAEGNIYTIIKNSYVGQYCGGPKFGDMNKDRTVTTLAANCNFGTFFGAGYGGNSYNRFAPTNKSEVTNTDWNTWVEEQYKQDYNSGRKGVSTQISHQFLPYSNNNSNVARLFVDYVSFSLATTRSVTSTLTGCTIEKNFYGGGSLGMVDGDVTSTLKDCMVHGSAFGAGFSAALPTVEVMNLGGFIKEPYYNENLGIYLEPTYPNTVTYTWEYRKTVNNTATAINTTDHILYTSANLDNLGTVTGKATLNIEGNTIVEGMVYNADGTVRSQSGGVFGGGDMSETQGDTEVNIGAENRSQINNVFGGGNVADVGGSVMVNLKSGTVLHDVYGGGALADTNTDNIGSTNATHSTTLYLSGGTVQGDVYGGGLGRLADDETGETAVAAIVGGDVTLYLNGQPTANGEGVDSVAYNQKGCVVEGDIYGCNNLNGTPRGNVTLHIYGTQHKDKTNISQKATVPIYTAYNNIHDGLRTRIADAEAFGLGDSDEATVARTVLSDANADTRELSNALSALEDAIESKQRDNYDVHAIYGGGNLAAYDPEPDNRNTTKKASIYVYGCDRSCIQFLYGGGNAAPTPANFIEIEGGRFDYVFGGGNGSGLGNPGANVGFYTYSDDVEYKEDYAYGTGQARTNIYGGVINHLFGGSNTKGNIRDEALSLLEKMNNSCDFNIGEAYGGGRNAPMDGEARLILTCAPQMTEIYGGAKYADVNNNVQLTITSGTFQRVFGGNNLGGTIYGTITVNVEETGCDNPIIINELYGGGNAAPYSVELIPQEREGVNFSDATQEDYYQNFPQVNVRSCTRIGTIYGGGLGATAEVKGNPHVNIDEVEGKYSSQIAGDNKLGAIGNVFGGGNAARVDGNTNVAIGTHSTVTFVTGEQAGQAQTVQGVNITGNVYGGGNEADVTGNTNVIVGQQEM